MQRGERYQTSNRASGHAKIIGLTPFSPISFQMCIPITEAMRTHSLSELEIEGRDMVLRVEPRFDFYRIKKASAVMIEFGPGANDAGQTSLVLTTDYQTESKAYRLTIRFDGVRELAFPEMQPFLQFAELEIEDVRDRMLEGVRFEVVSHYDRSFRCLCGGIVIVSFDPVS